MRSHSPRTPFSINARACTVWSGGGSAGRDGRPAIGWHAMQPVNMFPCMPCLGPRGALSDLADDVRDVSFKAVKVHRSAVKKQLVGQKSAGSSTNSSTAASRGIKEKEVSGGWEEEVENAETEWEASEWMAEVQPGVFIALVSLPLGGNRLKKIWFSKEFFDDEEARRWLESNCERIMSLYSVQQSNFPATPFQSDDETRISSSLESHQRDDNSVPSETGSAANPGEPAPPSFGGGGHGHGKDEGFEVKVEQPGVYVTVRSLPDGGKEMIRVAVSPEDFGGKVKAIVWWMENMERLRQRYSTK